METTQKSIAERLHEAHIKFRLKHQSEPASALYLGYEEVCDLEQYLHTIRFYAISVPPERLSFEGIPIYRVDAREHMTFA